MTKFFFTYRLLPVTAPLL